MASIYAIKLANNENDLSEHIKNLITTIIDGEEKEKEAATAELAEVSAVIDFHYYISAEFTFEPDTSIAYSTARFDSIEDFCRDRNFTGWGDFSEFDGMFNSCFDEDITYGNATVEGDDYEVIVRVKLACDHHPIRERNQRPGSLLRGLPVPLCTDDHIAYRLREIFQEIEILFRKTGARSRYNTDDRQDLIFHKYGHGRLRPDPHQGVVRPDNGLAV